MNIMRNWSGLFVVYLIILTGCSFTLWVNADELRPSYLQLNQTSDTTFAVLLKVPLKNNGKPLPINAQFDDDTQIISMPTVNYGESTENWSWSIRREQGLGGALITMDGLANTASEVLMRIVLNNGNSIVHRITPDQPFYRVQNESTWRQIVTTYFVLGVEHILFGFDHLLFVFALLLLVKQTFKLIATITAFTIAHSITLILAALNIIQIRVPPVEAVIALSIAFVATEIIHSQQGHFGLSARYPWLIALSFGLLHGLGFASALSEIGIPQNAIASALIVFNLGVEVGQVLFVLTVLAIWWLVKKVDLPTPSILKPVPAYVIGTLACFWMIERVAGF